MVRFAHISDVHLGGWKQPELQQLNLDSFRKAIEIIIKKKLDFVLIVGDLFDSAYPSIEILKETFTEFKKLKEARIPCYIVAGSHDYSVSGKTFLDVLERAGFCINVEKFEERENNLILHPTICGNIALYGYPGKKSSLEIPDLRRIKLNDSPGLFKILMLHTTLEQAKGMIPVDAIKPEELPKVEYYALGHLHIDFRYENFIYPGPIFPNNFQELEDLGGGSFYIIETFPSTRKFSSEKIELILKKVEPVAIKINNALTGTIKIIEELGKRNLEDKIILLRVSGQISEGKNSDIDFQKIEQFVKSKGAYFLLKNTHELESKEFELELEKETANSEEIEEEAIKIYSDENPSDFNKTIPQLIDALNIEKQEGETTETFENKILEGTKKIFNI